MKISNLTLYNYTGKQIILLDNSGLNQEDYINEKQNEDDYMDYDHLNRVQEIIDNGNSYDIEYRDIIADEENQDNEIINKKDQNNTFSSLYNNDYNKKIKIDIKECKIKGSNEINVDKVSTKKIAFKSRIKLNKELSKYSYIVSKVALNDKKKFHIFIQSPLLQK